jgi:hypothetical protein
MCRQDRRVAAALGGLLFVALAACTPTARTSGPYAAKARATARAVHSSVASDLLVIEAVRRGHTTAAYVSVALSEAEDAASEATSTFTSIQPPDDDSEQLESDLSELLNIAEDALGDARVAGRRGNNDELFEAVNLLQAVDEQLLNAADGEPFDVDQVSSSSSSSQESNSSEQESSSQSESGG